MTLRSRLLELIEREGPISFARAMEAALYDPADGFFSKPAVGERAHFVTSPHVSPLFARLLASQIERTRPVLGSDLTVVDAGAAEGSFLTQLRGHLDGRLIALERSAHGRAVVASAGFDTVASPEELPPLTGWIVANELFDNVPFHLLRDRDGETVEVFVGARDGALAETEGSPSAAALGALDRPLLPGEERPVSPAAARLLRALGARLRRGYLLVIDYGFVAGELPEPVRGYREHRMVTDLLAEPGSTDITGPVDLAALAAAGAQAGLEVWGPVTQRDALMALGYREALDEMRREQAHLESVGAWREAVDRFSARGQAAMLVERGGLGSLRILAFGTAGLEPPAAVSGAPVVVREPR